MDNLIITVDFDGTLCENKYPEIGKPNTEVIEHVKQMKSEGAKIILCTNRVNDKLDDAINWCSNNGIIFDAVNEDLP